MTPRSLLLAVVIVVAGTASACSDEFDDSVAAFKRRDYEAAVQAVLPLAEKGDVRAQMRVAGLYSSGYLLPRRYTDAAKWYRLAAEQGNPAAQYQVGYMHTHRMGLPFDQTEAARWFERAANQGHTGAQYELYRMYADGWGVPQDSVKAYVLLKLLMTYGNYTGGRGGRWQSSGGKSELRILERSMSEAQIAEAERLATEWKPKPER